MGVSSTECFALKWCYLFFGTGIILLIEYRNIYMKQLVLSLPKIGFTTLFGVFYYHYQCGAFLATDVEQRKLIFTVSTAVVFLTTLAPVLPLVVYFPTCLANESDAHESSINQASHHSQEYLEGISNTPGDVSIV